MPSFDDYFNGTPFSWMKFGGEHAIVSDVAKRLRDTSSGVDELETGYVTMNENGLFEIPGCETDLTRSVATRCVAGMREAEDFFRLYCS